MVRVMAVGIFDILHAGHLHYVEQAKSLGDELVVVIAHDETVRKQKHEPVTGQDLRRRMVEGLKPVDRAIVGNPPGVPIFEILEEVGPDLIALGYDQKHSIDAIRDGLDAHGFDVAQWGGTRPRNKDIVESALRPSGFGQVGVFLIPRPARSVITLRPSVRHG